MFRPRHTLETVAKRIHDGLLDGSVSLDGDAAEREARADVADAEAMKIQAEKIFLSYTERLQKLDAEMQALRAEIEGAADKALARELNAQSEAAITVEKLVAISKSMDLQELELTLHSERGGSQLEVSWGRSRKEREDVQDTPSAS